MVVNSLTRRGVLYMAKEGKESEVQRKLLGVCSDLLLEARYPFAVDARSITSAINKLRRIRAKVVE
jgi:hypothetical protein